MKIGIISGASSGIGKSIAKSLDSYCLDELWLIGRNIDKLNGVSSTLATKCKIFSLDLRDKDSYDVLNSALKETDYSVEYLVLSAGVGYNGSFNTITQDNISDMVEINCTSLTLLTHIFLPYMNEGAKIINIASGAGFLPQPGFCVYAATKAYVISFSRGLRQELKSKNIKVTAVCPGPVDTDFFAGLKDVKEYKKKFLISADVVAKKSLRAAKKGKAICTPSFSMKMVHLFSKIFPTALLLKFYK